MVNFIQIPLIDSDEAIELDLDQLPGGNEVLGILQQERPNLIIWITLALALYKQRRIEDFVNVLELSRTDASLNYRDHDTDQMRALDMLAAFYAQEANREKNEEKKRSLFAKATLVYTAADRIIMYDQEHVLGRAYLCLLKGNQMDQADTQFSFILNQSPDDIPCLLGKACVAFNKKDYKSALAYYKRVLRMNPKRLVLVRVGMGHCFAKLNNLTKSRMAYERALDLDDRCVDAMVGLAVLMRNSGTTDGIREGVRMMSEAHNIDPDNPMVLNHLADHYFFRKDYSKVHELALKALENTENEAMKAESCYQLARSCHIQNDFDQAFQYYYQATQFASPSFVLPYYGLAQMYIQHNDSENAIQCLNKVLKVHPENYESLKILGSLYSNSKSQSERKLAKTYLKKVTKRFPDDVDAWIELAQLLEENDLQGSLDAYNHVIDTLKENLQVDVGAEILNNVAALKYNLGKFDESLVEITASLERSKAKAAHDPSYFNSIAVTITYNLALIHEAQHRYDKAEKLYKDVLKEHPNYVDCYLRLGCIARDKGQIYEASDWFKDALRVDPENPDVWSLLGNLHMVKQEWLPAQRKFERVLQSSENKDTYSLIALGNIWLQYSQDNYKDKKQLVRHQDRALAIYKDALRKDSKNIWAVNGIGCILAHRRYIAEAHDIFGEIRDATADFPDVWLNIAHIYVEQKQYVGAMKLYENCLRRFNKYNDVEILMYLSRAYIKADQLKDAKLTISKARRVSPYDPFLLFNESLVLQELAIKTLKDEKVTLATVLKTLRELELARKNLKYLSNHDKKLVQCAAVEARRCQDLLFQAQHHVTRAEVLDQEEKLLKKKQEEQRSAIKQRQVEEQRKLDELCKQQEEQMLQKRQEFVEKTKSALKFIEMPKKDKKRRKASDGQVPSDAENSADEENSKKKTTKKKRKTKLSVKSSNGPRKRKKLPDDSEDDGEKPRKHGRKSDAAKSKLTKRIIFTDESDCDYDSYTLQSQIFRSRSTSTSRSRSRSKSRSCSQSRSSSAESKRSSSRSRSRSRSTSRE